MVFQITNLQSLSYLTIGQSPHHSMTICPNYYIVAKTSSSGLNTSVNMYLIPLITLIMLFSRKSWSTINLPSIQCAVASRELGPPEIWARATVRFILAQRVHRIINLHTHIRNKLLSSLQTFGPINPSLYSQ